MNRRIAGLLVIAALFCSHPSRAAAQRVWTPTSMLTYGALGGALGVSVEVVQERGLRRREATSTQSLILAPAPRGGVQLGVRRSFG